ncbi:MAG: helix-turn-helix transcriptional regulator, partial [Kiritimatiellae bacterium]|nr:helix-turn-helix transcriptional regulator [Kiritimatiellia bacterium]
AQLLFQALFSTFFALKGVFATHEGDATEQLEKLIEMKGHRVKLGEMARELHHSPSWLRARFRVERGSTPGKAKQAQTLHLAQYYIQQTKLPFRQIALRLGMSSASYFSYYVRRHLGKTPRQLRAASTRS